MVIVLISSIDSYAQEEEEEGHYYTVTTWKFKVPADGSNAELDSLLKVWQEEVVLKNDKILSEKVLRHLWGSDMRDWVFITEYANWNDIKEAGEMQGKLVEAAWPDKEDRKEFFKSFNKYGVTHSDELYMDLPALAK
jgi:hypothetical protein